MEFGWNRCGFSDPARKVQDTRKDYGEARYNMPAKVLVGFRSPYIERGEITWIISAQQGKQTEQRRYG